MILPIEKQVVSLELAKRLKELGAPQESLFYWVRITDEHWECVPECNSRFFVKDDKVAAYTSSELGELLPTEINWGQGFHCLEILRIRDKKRDWYVRYYSQGSGLAPKGKMANTEADARAKMLIYLLENTLITL